MEAEWVWGFTLKERLSWPILTWSRVFLGSCSLLAGWWRWQRSVPPSHTDPEVSPGQAQTGNLCCKKEASTIKINRRLKTEANRPRHKNSNTGASYLLRRHRLHRLCQQCIWGQFSLQGRFQSCHLERRGEKQFTSTQGQETGWNRCQEMGEKRRKYYFEP